MTDILIGYVDNFQFSNPEIAEKLAPHPKQGSVYRILKSYTEPKGSTKPLPIYQIYIGRDNNKAGMDTMFLGHSLEGEYFNKWSFSIVPVTKDNIIEFDIKSEELPNLLNWLDTDHAELKSLLDKSPTPVDMNLATGEVAFAEPEAPSSELQKVITKIKDAEDKYDEALNKLSYGLNLIVSKDRDFTMVLSDLFSYLGSTYKDKYEDSGKANMSRDFLMTSESPDVALFNALKYIQRYSTTGFEKSANPKDLLKAIHYCLFELQRVQTQADNE